MRRERLLVTLGFVAATATFALLRYLRAPAMSSDLDQLWYAARALLQGADPYAVVGPGRQFPWAWPLYYPLPAVLLVVPFSLLPLALARIAFAIVCSAALGYAIGSRWRVLWPLLLSTSYYLAISRNQLAPLILASIWIPALGFVLAAKPNIGLVALAAQGRRGAVMMVLLAVGLVVVSLLLQPAWPLEWFDLVRRAPQKSIALLQPGGFVLLAALFLWRSPDGRMLLVASVVPQTPSLYDVLPLFALCRTLRQSLLLAALTHMLQLTALAVGPYGTFDASYETLGRLQVWFILVPVLAFAIANHLSHSNGPGEPRGAGRVRTADSLANWMNRALLVIVAAGLGIQLWVVFRP